MKRDAIPDSILAEFKKTYDAKITKEDIFYYVYGILHSPEYKRLWGSKTSSVEILCGFPLILVMETTQYRPYHYPSSHRWHN